jgi:hypothetical protein
MVTSTVLSIWDLLEENIVILAGGCIWAIPKTLRGLRDRALLLVGLAAALRPSAISGLTLEHATRHVGGIEVFLSRRKNEQGVRGTRLWLPRGRTDLCPGKALEALN